MFCILYILWYYTLVPVFLFLMINKIMFYLHLGLGTIVWMSYEITIIPNRTGYCRDMIPIEYNYIQ